MIDDIDFLAKGALNEAMSDIFSALVEFYIGTTGDNIWLLGEDVWTPGVAGDALRYMCDPVIADDYDYYPDRYQGEEDYGGVHWNSGIANLGEFM
jgi:bacillolysin